MPSPERVAEIEQRTHHDLAAFVDAVAGELGPAGRWFHYGLTSSDVVDTALALQIARRRRARSWPGSTARSRRSGSAAEEHRLTITIGRTHGVHAEPTTFGLKLAVWAFELERDRERLAAALEGVRVGKLSGAVGNYAAIDPEVERIACEQPRARAGAGRDAGRAARPACDLLPTLALAAASLERFALEIRHLARTEVAEVQEPFGKGQKGSSAMPHKRNPVVAERICGLARVVRAASIVGLENVALWHERDISHSSAERVTIPDAFLALDYMLDRFSWLVEGLVVRTEQMRRNLELSRGLYFSQRLLLALVETRALARRGVPARPGTRDARLGGGARLPGARARGSGDHEATRRRLRSTRSSISATTRATSTPSSSVCTPSRTRRSPFMPETKSYTSAAARSASSTRSTTSAYC